MVNIQTSCYKLFIIVIFQVLSLAQLKAQTQSILEEGDKLMYEVATADQIYWFSVDLIKLDQSISFSWSMSAPINKTGYITLSGNALQNADRYINRFTSGTKDLDLESSVFLSETNFNELITKGSTFMDMDEGSSGTWKNHGMDNYVFIWKGSDYSPNAYYLTLDNTGSETRSIVVLADGPFHLILHMNLGWTIQLKEII